MTTAPSLTTRPQHLAVPRSRVVTAERTAQAGAVAVIVALIVHATWAARGLIADGSSYLLNELSTGHMTFLGPTRIFAQVLTQLPVVGALHLGVDNMPTLIRLHTFGLVGVPLLIWIAALILQWNGRFFWPIVAMFAAGYLTTGFDAVGEYNTANALVALIAAVLLHHGPLNRTRRVVLLAASVAVILCYESLVFLGPALLALAILRGVRPGWFGTTSEANERLVLGVAAGCAVAATIAAAWLILYPRDARNLSGAANVTGALRLDPQIAPALGLAALIAAAAFLRSRVAAGIVSVVLAVASLLLLQQRYWAVWWMHYLARSLASGAVFVVLIISATAALIRVRGGTTRTGWAWIAPLTFLIVLAVPMTIDTAGFASWVSAEQHYIRTHTGVHPIDTTPEWNQTRMDVVGHVHVDYGSWTDPWMSVLLQATPNGAVIDTPSTTHDGTTPYDPAHPPRRPLPQIDTRPPLF